MLPICMKMKRCCADCGEAAGDATLVFVDIALTVAVLGKLAPRLVAALGSLISKQIGKMISGFVSS